MPWQLRRPLPEHWSQHNLSQRLLLLLLQRRRRLLRISTSSQLLPLHLQASRTGVRAFHRPNGTCLQLVSLSTFRRQSLHGLPLQSQSSRTPPLIRATQPMLRHQPSLSHLLHLQWAEMRGQVLPLRLTPPSAPQRAQSYRSKSLPQPAQTAESLTTQHTSRSKDLHSQHKSQHFYPRVPVNRVQRCLPHLPSWSAVTSWTGLSRIRGYGYRSDPPTLTFWGSCSEPSAQVSRMPLGSNKRHRSSMPSPQQAAWPTCVLHWPTVPRWRACRAPTPVSTLQASPRS